MPYPYTLMPDGQTLEPEEEQEPEPSNEGTPAEPESGPKPPPGIDIPGYTPTPGYGPPPAPPISLPAPPPGIPVPPDILDLNPDTVGSIEQHIAALNSGQSTSGFPQDIEWSPEDEPSGIVPFVQAAAARTRDSSEDKTTVVCEALYAADPEGVARGIKIMTGCAPDNDDRAVLSEFIHLARSVGLDEYLAGVEAWYTTRLGPSESFTAAANDEELLSGLSQPPAETSTDEAPELSRRLRYSLTESFPGEWEASLTDKEDLETRLLIPKLKRFIHGFDENSVNWGDFTVQESIDFYLKQMAGELMALSTNLAVSDEYFQEVKAEYEWAADLQELAKPIPLDDTTAYTEVFNVGAEGERTHVQKQLAVIYDYLDITPADDHLESRSTADLKYELYSLLVHNVIPLRGSDQDPLAAQLFRSYTEAAGVSPQDAVDRLQGTYREPDVLGFLFVMGLTMLVEPLDWVLTTVDVINALSEGDVESAVGNFILGAVPFASSRMDDAFRLLDDLGAPRLGGRLDNTPKYFANPVGKGNVSPSSEFVERLMSEHGKLDVKVAEDAIRGAERVKGANVDGADILLPSGVEREITVHTGRQANLISHIASKTRQFSDDVTRKEMYVQIKPGDGVVIDKRSLLNEITDEQVGWQTKSALPELDGVYVKVFGPDGEVWWDGTFTVELYE